MYKVFAGEQEVKTGLNAYVFRGDGSRPNHWKTDSGVIIDRVVWFKDKGASLHVCDDRCRFAQGRVMQCECSCGGKYHGIGKLACN